MPIAFASCSWNTTDAVNSQLMPEVARDMGEQRYRRATFRMPRGDSEEAACIKPRCGGLIGDPYMARNFAASFAPCIQRW
eukprot:276188-Pyramimonas_sp.AAC.1